MWLWRKVRNISWSDKVSNDEVIRRVGEERSIVNIIHRRQRAWLGHTLRHGDLLPLVIEGRGGEGGLLGALNRIRSESSYESVKETSYGAKTIRKDLPAGRAHTHTAQHWWQLRTSENI